MYKFYLHAGSANHGCEAIVRSSINILNDEVTLYSRVPELDTKYGIDEICDLHKDDKILLKVGSFR